MLSPSKILADYALLHVLCALQSSGVFTELKKNPKGVLTSSLATTLSLEVPFLVPLCDFLVINAPEILTKKEEKYFLEPFFDERALQNTLFFALSYQSVFTHLKPLLTGEKKYGQDVVRDGAALRLSSALYNGQAWNQVIGLFRSMKVDTVVDIGCSAGDFLQRVQETSPLMRCIGVEIDSQVVALAQEVSRKSVAEERPLIIEGDAGTPEAWAPHIEPKTDFQHVVFVGTTVWHEFLSEGEERVIDIFTRYRKYFPGSAFIVIEYNGATMENMLALPESLRETGSVYQLVHPLTHQGMPQPPSVWRRIFERVGIPIENSIAVYPNSSIYICTL